MGDERPGNGAGDCRFEILCQPATATEPCESAFDDPSARQNFEALRRVGALDNFDRPFAHAFQRPAQFLPGIAAVGEDMAQYCGRATSVQTIVLSFESIQSKGITTG